MLYNLRYYSALALAAFLCLVAILGLYASQYSSKRIVQDISSQYAQTHAQFFQSAVWERYFPIINFVAQDNKRDPSIIPSYMIFEKEMDVLFDKPEIVVAEFFNNGKLLYNSQGKVEAVDEVDIVDATTKMKLEKNKIVKKSISGGDALYLYRSAYEPQLSDLPEIYKKFTNNLQPQLIVYYDVDAKVKQFKYLILTVCGLFTLAALGAFAYMYFYSYKLEKLIERGGVGSGSDTSGVEGGSNVAVQSQFFTNLNHELRTPLNAIIGFSELIQNESMGPLENPKYKEFVDNIYESGRNLLALIDDAQDFTQSSENKLEINMQDMDFTKIIKLCIKMLDGKLQSKGIELDDQMPKTHYVIFADPNRVKKVVLALLEHSIKLSNDSGKIALRYIIDGEYSNKNRKITFEIKDDGVGMAPEELNRALSPFGQLGDDALNSQPQSVSAEGIQQHVGEVTSLSMPLTKQLIEMMHGKFDITSELNLGTTVRVTFPLKAEEE